MRASTVIAAAALLAFLFKPAAAPAAVFVQINKSTQQMTVSVDGEPRYVWPVSTGRQGYDTPSGSYRAFRMEADHFSKEWDDAPMPHSIFFTPEGHAIHGTDHVRNLGMPASHGCVRLSRAHASILFDLVRREGLLSTKVVLTGHTPAYAPQVARPGYPSGNPYGGNPGAPTAGPLNLSPAPGASAYGQFNESGNGAGFIPFVPFVRPFSGQD